jgi:hypothetical protein
MLPRSPSSSNILNVQWRNMSAKAHPAHPATERRRKAIWDAAGHGAPHRQAVVTAAPSAAAKAAVSSAPDALPSDGFVRSGRRRGHTGRALQTRLRLERVGDDRPKPARNGGPVTPMTAAAASTANRPSHPAPPKARAVMQHAPAAALTGLPAQPATVEGAVVELACVGAVRAPSRAAESRATQKPAGHSAAHHGASQLWREGP